MDPFDVLLQTLERLVEDFLGRLVRIPVRIQIVGVTKLAKVLKQLMETFLHEVVLETYSKAPLDLVRVVRHIGVGVPGYRVNDLRNESVTILVIPLTTGECFLFTTYFQPIKEGFKEAIFLFHTLGMSCRQIGHSFC